MEKLALESRRNEAGRKADDPRLLHLLNLLIFFRNVILQDAPFCIQNTPTAHSSTTTHLQRRYFIRSL